MNLDLDDPLGDLLSEGSNDSFFGIEPSKKAKDKEKSEENLASGKFGQPNKMESLFGIPSEKAAPVKPKATDYTLKSTAEEPSSLTMVKMPSTPPMKAMESAGKMQKKANDSDITSDLGFDPRKPRKKSNILDELLGIDKTVIAPKPRDPSPPIKKSISRQTTSETTSENVNTESGYTPSVTRKSGRRQSAVAFSDPLGLFGSSEKEKEIKVSAKARKSIAGPEWLTVDVENTSKLTKMKSSPSIQVTKNSEERSDSEPVTVASFESKPLLTTISDYPRNPQMMETLTSDTNSSLQNLKQQEFQLMVASQMKTQENVLLDMKHKQQELLHQQELQFNDLLKKQIFRQSELEDIIKQQQERINTHIQVLMTSQANAPYIDNRFVTEKAQKSEKKEENPIERIELEAELKKLEMEKLRLEDLLSNVNDNHEKEIIMIEQSYKKRISMLEDSLQSLENRYKDEIKNMEDFFQRKITSSDLEKQHIISNFENQLKAFENDRQSTIAKLKINYETDLESLKRHYEDMVENIRKSKLIEFAVAQESTSYIDVLRQASNNLESASGDISSLHEILQEKMMVQEKEKELQLANREKKIEDQQRLLERTRDASELERNKLLELIQTLELKLNSIEIKSDEEQWTLRQQLSSLEVERKSFEKEREYQRKQQGIEEKRVAELKQIQLNEFSKLMLQVDEEKAKIQEAKVQLEVSKQLSGHHSRSEISRAEIDAGVKFAEDAANQSDRERQRLIELQRQCETKKRELIDQENLFRSKQTELETAINRAKAKERAADSLIKNAKKTELSLVAKYQSLQNYATEMSDRESKISNQKIELSKERLELQSLRQKLYDSRCSLCKIGDQAMELKNIIQRDPNDFDNIGNNISSDPLRRFEVTDQLLDGNAIARSSASMEDFFKQDINVDLDGVPNLTDMSDDLLDSDLLLLKFNVLNFKNDIKNTEY